VAAPVSLVAGVVLVAVGWRLPHAVSGLCGHSGGDVRHQRAVSPGSLVARRNQVVETARPLDDLLAIAGGYTGYCAVALPSSLAAALAFSSAVAECPVLCRAGRGRRVRAGDLLRHGGVVALALLCTGGGVYLLGALAYATRRPNPLPSTFGFHEVFHACTVVATCLATTSACGSRSTPDLAPARHLVATCGTAASDNEHADLRERRCRPPAHALARDRPARPPAAARRGGRLATGCNNGCGAGPASRPAEGRRRARLVRATVVLAALAVPLVVLGIAAFRHVRSQPPA